MTERELPLLLKISEVCRELNCGRTHVYALMNRGDLEYVKDGKYRRVPRRSLLAYVGRHSRKAKGLRVQPDDRAG